MILKIPYYKLLLCVLLIVGCTHNPPTATFYIGMTTEEFEKMNITETSWGPGDAPITKAPHGVNNTQSYYEGAAMGFTSYIYAFHNDTLVGVFRGIKNVMLKKPIDYSKYPNSKPE